MAWWSCRGARRGRPQEGAGPGPDRTPDAAVHREIQVHQGSRREVRPHLTRRGAKEVKITSLGSRGVSKMTIRNYGWTSLAAAAFFASVLAPAPAKAQLWTWTKDQMTEYTKAWTGDRFAGRPAQGPGRLIARAKGLSQEEITIIGVRREPPSTPHPAAGAAAAGGATANTWAIGRSCIPKRTWPAGLYHAVHARARGSGRRGQRQGPRARASRPSAISMSSTCCSRAMCWWWTCSGRKKAAPSSATISSTTS